MPTVVISPFNVVNFPEGGGHFWVYMQYAQGLRQLGCDVYWLQRVRSSGDPEVGHERLSPFLGRMQRFGLGGKTILDCSKEEDNPPGMPWHYLGIGPAEAEAIFERADLLLNFHYAIAPGLLKRFRRTALVDIDPGLLQFWISRGQLSVPAHDLYFTTGETVGTAAALFPDCGLDWIHIRPPVFLEQWPYAFDPQADAFTTVSNWDADDWIVDGKEEYENTKRVAFLEFADLPRLTTQPLELALFLRTAKDTEERRDLEKRGWRVRLSSEVANTPEKYQSYIQQSRGEYSCAKRTCMKFQNAWISDRTLCYLASGKPAVVQHTGPSGFLPSGEGLFRFSTIPEAVAAFEKIRPDYKRHSRAARKVVETYFNARDVAANILSRALNGARPKPQTARAVSGTSI